MKWSARRVSGFLSRLRTAIEADRVWVTHYAATFATEDLQWDREDILLQLTDLEPGDFLRVERSTRRSGDVIAVFTPEPETTGRLWVRLVERGGIIVVSFHRA